LRQESRKKILRGKEFKEQKRKLDALEFVKESVTLD